MRIELEAGMLPGYAWAMVEPSTDTAGAVAATSGAPTAGAVAPVVRVRSPPSSYFSDPAALKGATK